MKQLSALQKKFDMQQESLKKKEDELEEAKQYNEQLQEKNNQLQSTNIDWNEINRIENEAKQLENQSMVKQRRVQELQANINRISKYGENKEILSVMHKALQGGQDETLALIAYLISTLNEKEDQSDAQIKAHFESLSEDNQALIENLKTQESPAFKIYEQLKNQKNDDENNV